MDVRFIIGLIFLMLDGIYATECDKDSCLQFCQAVHLNGTCDTSGKCVCSFGQTCSTMGTTCDLACKVLHMDGECDGNDMCQCSATPEWCAAIECQESCQEDPRSVECLYVEAVGCVEYGPITFCQCMCYEWSPHRKSSTKQWSVLRKTGISTKNKIPEVLKI